LEVLGRRGETTVTALAQALGVELPVLSRHLAVLREAGLVSQKQVGRNRLYRIEAAALRDVFDWASGFGELWGDRPAKKKG
jgi:DNA-binding transcriptional ArsR family regulator